MLITSLITFCVRGFESGLRTLTCLSSFLLQSSKHQTLDFISPMAAISTSSPSSLRSLRSASSNSSPALIPLTRVSFPAKISHLSGNKSPNRDNETGQRTERIIRSVDKMVSDAPLTTPESK